MSINESQFENAKQFLHLHHSDKLLILPNIWDPIGVKLMEDLGFPAIATASASIAFSKGYKDGECLSFQQMLESVKQIVRNATVPISMDFESGYADNNQVLICNAIKAIETGIIGINIEDRLPKNFQLLSVTEQCRKIEIIRNVSEKMGIQLFINARTDIYDIQDGKSLKEKKIEAIKRGSAYVNAGANCFYPIFLNDTGDLMEIRQKLQCPINVLLNENLPNIQTLKKIGIARLSLGPSLFKVAITAMKNAAMNLSNNNTQDFLSKDILSYRQIERIIENKKGA
ncbi:isocitrate lyase/phosphoenolpyruvate mutase family protein [Flavobacteriales bacterium]|nr:isocitrate lyase/phosphoenolpyruvate mutase family protein [Flavobacteriales bacterium]